MPIEFGKSVIRLRRFLTLMLVATLVLWTVSGCDARPSVPGAHLAGAVTIDGQPVEEGSISFTPSRSSRGPAVGGPIHAGRYDCAYVPLGQSLVQIYALKPTGKMIEVMGSMVPEKKDLVPEKDRDGFQIEVQQDNLNQDFALSSLSGDATGR